MDREQIKKMIQDARSLGVKLDEAMVSRFEAGSMNGGQEIYFLRQLETGIQQKQPKDVPHSAEKVLIAKAKSLGVDTGPFEQLAKPGSVSSMVELKLKSELKNEIAEKERLT